jgi:hypothetical protein
VLIEPGTKPDDHNLRIPDLSITCGPIDPAVRFSNPVLIVENLLPSNWRKTMRNVASYALIDGLTEVLVLLALARFARARTSCTASGCHSGRTSAR